MNKRVFLCLLLACLGIPWPTRAALITGTLLDITGSLHPDKKIVFTPLDTPKDVQTGTVIWTPRQVTSVDGVWSATLGAGKYQLSIDGIVWRKICVPSGAGPYSLHAGELNCGPISIWVGDTNMLHKPLSDGDDQTPGFLLDKFTAGTNIVFVTTGTTNKTTSINAVVPDTDDHLLLVSSFDETPGLLADKILFGNGLSGSINGVEDDQLIIELENIGANGTFGDATHFPVITVNDKGMVTSVTTNAFTAGPTVNDANWLSYAINSTTLGNSPFYRVSTNEVGFNSTNRFILYDPDRTWPDEGVLAIGEGALAVVGSGLGEQARTVAIGEDALGAATTAGGTTAIGWGAGASTTSLINSVVIGSAAGQVGNGVDIVSIGQSAGPAFGTFTQDTHVGNATGLSMAGSTNSTFGAYAGYPGSGSSITSLGAYSGLYTQGILGVRQRDYSTFVGAYAGSTPSVDVNITNAVAIGFNAKITNSNEIVIGNANNTKAYLPPEVYAGGVLLGSGGGGTAGTVINTVAASGLLSVDSTKTNGIAATSGHVTTALGYTPVNKAGDTMSGTLTVAGLTNTARTASTFVVAAADKSDTSTAASSVLASTLTDETGTGVAVFGTSPVFNTSIEIRNGANAQTLYVNGTYTDSSNYRRGKVTDSTAGVLDIASEGLGTGATGNTLRFLTDGTARWTVNSSGHLLAVADNTYDIGASGATRPRHYYGGGNVNCQNFIGSGAISLGLGTSINATVADGTFRLSNNAGTDFGRLQFGGTTASFPSIKRNGPALNIRTADDTADAVLTYLDQLNVGSAVTLSTTNRFYLVNVDAQTVTLPTAVGASGKTYSIKTISPAATATVATTSSQLIDGASTYSLTASNKYVRVTSDGTNWWIFGSN